MTQEIRLSSLYFSSLLVTKRRKGRPDKGRQAKACGSELRTTETDAGVLVQYVEEVEEVQRTGE